MDLDALLIISNTRHANYKQFGNQALEMLAIQYIEQRKEALTVSFDRAASILLVDCFGLVKPIWSN